MKRDGSSTSLWQHDMPNYQPRNNPNLEKQFDVLVIGGGITGVTTALQLQKQGLQCLVCEAHNLCFGTTGGTTAHLNTYLDSSYDSIEDKFGEDNARLVAQAVKDALALFHSHVHQYQIDCGYSQKDGFLFSENEEQSEQLHRILQASKKAGIDVEETGRLPLPISFEKAIVFHGQAGLHPTRYVYALAKAYEQLGGSILQNCMVIHAKGEGPFSVETSQGIIQANNVIWATHIPAGINLLDFRCAPYRSYALALRLQQDAYPDALVYDMHDPYHYYRTQEIDGEKFFIVGGEDHKTAHVQHTESCFNKLEAHARKYFPVKEVAFKWSSQYFEPADGLPYIGHLPGAANGIYVATGYSGNGITYSHVAAIIFSQVIGGDESSYAKLFDPARLKPVAGFTNFVKENADVVKEFIGKRLSKTAIRSLAELAPGEAKLVKYEGKPLALYKDEGGNVHALNPVCTHAKCLVDWNSAEKSWDCPCHGSRFNIDGEVVTGPAHHALEKVDIRNLVQE